MPLSTPGALVNWTPEYSTTCQWLRHRARKSRSPTRQYLGARLGKDPAYGLPVIHDEPDVAGAVGRLGAAFGEGNKLVAGVDKRHARSTPAQPYLREMAVELQSLLFIADLKSYVVYPNEFRAGAHDSFPLPSERARHYSADSFALR